MADSNDSAATETEVAEDQTEEVETSNEEDESQTDQDNQEDEQNEETEEEAKDEATDDATDSEEEEAEEDGFSKRFTQLKGDTPEEYLGSLEDAYAKSTTEGQRLAGENKELKSRLESLTQLVAQDAELAEKLSKVIDGDVKVQLDPRMKALADEVEQKWEKEYNQFVESHPEVAADQTLAEKLNSAMAQVRDFVYKTEGRQIGMAEGLERAWKLLDIDDSEEKTRMAAKNVASQTRVASGKAKAKAAPKLTDAQQKLAAKMGLDPKKVEQYATQSS